MDTFHLLVGSDTGDIAWWQMSVRGVLIFFIGLVLVRIAATRAFGRWGALDIILAVIVGSNLSRALTGSAPFMPTVIATFLLVMLHGLLSWAAIRWPQISNLAKGRPTQLVSDGECDWAAMRRHGLGPGDLDSALRSSGHESLDHVEAVYLERNGDISVIDKR